jgi:hypothetical protein
MEVSMHIFNKLDVARKTWAAVMKKYGALLRERALSVEIAAYCNGREQGYTVVVYFKKEGVGVTETQFAENRNSDDIVVYAGNVSDPLIPEAKREATYRAAQYATPGNYDRAAVLVARAIGLI